MRKNYIKVGIVGAMVAIFVSTGLMLCAAEPRLSSIERRLVGKWLADGETSHSVIIRYPNKTFSEEDISEYPDKNAPIRFTTRGTWRVSGSHYIMRFTEVSNPRFKSWLKQEFSYGIGKITDKEFTYLGEDTPVIVEKKIGEAKK